jgi:putative ABC transport system permease protein
MSSITLGVAALVAINSFRTNALESVARESRALLGSDLRLESNRAFSAQMEALLDTASSNYDVARVTALISMGVSAGTGETRLVQLRAIEPGYPFYGSIETEPRGAWQRLHQGGGVIVDESLLAHLALAPGDSLLLGEAAFAITAVLKKGPADFGFRNVIGPRVYIAAADLPKTGLLRFGSLAEYQVFLRIANDQALERFVDQRHDVFRRNLVDFDTAKEQSDNLATALATLSRFLGLVGLAALLLGGIGVATAVHVFIKDKRSVVAVLRCLGAHQRTVFAAYLTQAAVLSLVGAVLGVVLGFGVQAFLPRVLSAMVPFDVPFAIDWISVAAGIGIGLLVAVLFALVPLLSIRGVSPLQALRVEYEPAQRRVDAYRVLALVALIVVLTGLCLWQADDYRAGLGFAGALAGGLFILWLVALTLTRLTRRMVGRGTRFWLRQGIANLYRPHNQTVSVTLSLGFGVFVIATMLSVQNNLLAWLNVETRGNAPNLIAFDIQADQQASVAAVFARHHAAATTFTPIVPAKITALNGITVDSVLSSSAARRVEPWALRREYRNTYRDTMVASEELVSGEWFDGVRQGVGASGRQGAIPVSIEQDVARDLGLKLGDRVSWDFQGVPVESRITSIRKVDWARFNTNFFVVFPSGTLDHAPQTFVALGSVTDAGERAALQRDLVAAHSNVSILDLATVRAALDSLLSKVTLAIRFMALFSIIAGVIVLIGAVATARFQRLRESALLKTLGATRRQITQVLVTEYAALGTLAGATGVLLGSIASWLLMRFFFRLDYHMPLGALLLLWVGVALLAVVVGWLNSRDVFRRPPLAVLREISE